MSVAAKKDQGGSKRPRLPVWLVAPALVVLALSWVPLVFIARGRVMTTENPRVQLIQDMGKQPTYREQASSSVFADGRADRPRIPDTVARGQLQDDDHYDRGFTQTLSAAGKYEVKYFTGLPSRVPLTQQLLERGQQRFNIYCATCHGADGYGNGPISARAIELQTPTWIPPTSLHSDTVRGRADGHLFNTITNGIRNMPPYGPQIPVEDRWAIVAYMRALQLSQNARPADVPPERLERMR